MGIYINPRDDFDAREKEDKILRVGTVVTRNEFRAHVPGFDNKFGVALVDNGSFIAAGVAYSKEEAWAFSTDNDYRPITYGLVSLDEIEKLDPFAASTIRRYSENAKK